MKSDRRTAAALMVATFVLYCANFHVTSSVDNSVNRVLPFSILREGNLDLNEFSQIRETRRLYPTLVRAGRIYPANSIVPALLITPAYIVPDRLLQWSGIAFDDVRALVMISTLERLCAAAMTALCVGVLFLTLRRMLDRGPALAGALTCGVGTNLWVICGQGIWTHTPAVLMLAILNHLLLRPICGRPHLVLAGTVASIMVGCRPQMLPFAALATVYVGWTRKKDVGAFIFAPAVVAVLLGAYNLSTFRSLAGHYWNFEHFSAPFVTGLAGLLVSPNRGLFVFSPVLLFCLPGVRRTWRELRSSWFGYLVVGIVIHLAIYAKFDEWWGGHTYGPRYMTDVLPVLGLFLVPVLRRLSEPGWIRWAYGAAALWSVAIQILGVYFDADEWNRTPANVQSQPERVFDLTDWQVVRAARTPWRGSEMLPLFASVFDEPVPARAVRLEPVDLESRLVLADVPGSVTPGSKFDLAVTVTNLGQKSWPAFTGGIIMKDSVVLVLRWAEAGSSAVVGGDVVQLPRNVPPGGSLSHRIRLQVPDVEPGELEMRLTVAQVIDGNKGVSSKQSWVATVNVR